MDDAFCAAVHGGSGIIGIYSVSGSLSQIYLHAVIINVVVDGSGSVASATHAGDEVIRIVAAYLPSNCHFSSSEITLCILATMSG